MKKYAVLFAAVGVIAGIGFVLSNPSYIGLTVNNNTMQFGKSISVIGMLILGFIVALNYLRK